MVLVGSPYIFHWYDFLLVANSNPYPSLLKKPYILLINQNVRSPTPTLTLSHYSTLLCGIGCRFIFVSGKGNSCTIILSLLLLLTFLFFFLPILVLFRVFPFLSLSILSFLFYVVYLSFTLYVLIIFFLFLLSNCLEDVLPCRIALLGQHILVHVRSPETLQGGVDTFKAVLP